MVPVTVPVGVTRGSSAGLGLVGVVSFSPVNAAVERPRTATSAKSLSMRIYFSFEAQECADQRQQRGESSPVCCRNLSLWAMWILAGAPKKSSGLSGWYDL